MPLDQRSVNTLCFMGGVVPRRFRLGLKDRGGCNALHDDVRVVYDVRAVPATRRKARPRECAVILLLHSTRVRRAVRPVPRWAVARPSCASSLIRASALPSADRHLQRFPALVLSSPPLLLQTVSHSAHSLRQPLIQARPPVRPSVPWWSEERCGVLGTTPAMLIRRRASWRLQTLH